MFVKSSKDFHDNHRNHNEKNMLEVENGYRKISTTLE